MFVLVGLVVGVAPAVAPTVVVSAASGSIPEFSVNSQLGVHIKVSCPGSVGFDWQVSVDSWNFPGIVEHTDAGQDFTLNGSLISNGHHNAIARVHCNNESWSDNPNSTVSFDWFGGNPTPVPPPAGHEVSVTISVENTTVPPNGVVKISAAASCANTNVRAIRVSVNGQELNQVGDRQITLQWSSSNPGQYTLTAEAECSGNDQWKTSAGASVVVTVQQGAQPSGGQGASGVNGGTTTNTNPGNLAQPTQQPTSIPQVIGCALPQRLNVGMQGRVVYGQGATSLRNNPEGTIIVREPEGAQFTVIDGPVCGSLGNRWWKVSMADGQTGWMPEGDVPGSVYWLEPTNGNVIVVTTVLDTNCSGANQKRVSNGSVAQTTQGIASNLRQDHNAGSKILRKLQPGTQVVITGEAVCGVNSSGLPGWWWPVKLNDGTTGWIIEGAGGDWVLQPVSPAPATVTPVPPDQPPSAQYPNAQLQDGGIDLGKYCKDIGFDVEQHSNQDAYSFRCVKDQQVYPMNLAAWNKACFDVWGSVRPNATLSNSTELGAWKCQANPGIIDPYRTPVAPTATPMPQATNVPKPVQPQVTQAPDQFDPCGNAYNIVPNEGTGLVAYYLKSQATPTVTPMQCVYFVSNVAYPKLSSECSISGNAGTWAHWARTNNCKGQLSVSPANDGDTLNPSDIRYGDIVVFSPKDSKSSCGVFPWPGHVGVVVDASNAASHSLVIANSNVPGSNGQPEIDTRNKLDYSCTSVIHVPWQYQGIGAQPVSITKRGDPVSVSGTCWACSGGSYTIKFLLPAGTCNFDSIQLYSTLTNGDQTASITQVIVGSDGTNDRVQLVIDPNAINSLGNQFGFPQIQATSAWYITYKTK